MGFVCVKNTISNRFSAAPLAGTGSSGPAESAAGGLETLRQLRRRDRPRPPRAGSATGSSSAPRRQSCSPVSAATTSRAVEAPLARTGCRRGIGAERDEAARLLRRDPQPPGADPNLSTASLLIDLERGADGVDCPVYRHPVHSIMIRGFRHRGLRRLYERGDPSRVGPGLDGSRRARPGRPGRCSQAL